MFASDDDDDGQTEEYARFDLEAGQTYYLSVSSSYTEWGDDYAVTMGLDGNTAPTFSAEDTLTGVDEGTDAEFSLTDLLGNAFDADSDPLEISGTISVTANFGDDILIGTANRVGDTFTITLDDADYNGDVYLAYAQRYNSAGVAQGGEVHVNTTSAGNQRFPATTALDDGGYVIAWQDSTSTEIQFQRYNSSGVAQGTNTVASASAPGNQTDPAIAALSTGGFVIVWTSSNDGGGSGIYAQRFTASGTADGSTILINTTTSGDQIAASVATMTNGSFVVTWTSADAASNGIFQKIIEANTAPYLEADLASLTDGSEDIDYSVSTATLLQGVVDGEDDDLTVTSLSGDDFTAVYDEEDDAWVITPAANFSGTLTLNYTVSDGSGGTLDLTQELVIGAVNDAPIVTGDLDDTATEGGSSVVIDALDNASDVEESELSVTPEDELPAGVTFSGSTFTFDPTDEAYDYLADGETADIVIDYEISDGTDTTDASITITVTGTNDAPVFEVSGDTEGSVTEDASVIVSLIGSPVGPAETQTATGDIDFGDVDLSDTHTVDVESQDIISGLGSVMPHPYVGTLIASVTQAGKGGGGTVNWTFSVDNDDIQFLAEGQTLTQTYEITVSDGFATDTETVTITITGTNDAPTLSGAQATLDDGTEDEDYIVSVEDLLAGFSDVDTTDELTVANLTASNGATVTNNFDGTYTIEHADDFDGMITLTYAVNDGHDGSIEGVTLDYDVVAVNDAPIGEDSASIMGTEDEDKVIDLADLISDVDNPDSELTITAESEDGTITVDGTEITFTPDADFQGTTTITYTVEDEDGETDTGTLTVIIANENDAPTADDFDGGTTEEEEAIVIDVASYIDDIDPSETLTVTEATSEDGTITIDGTELTFTPADDFYGTATITYTVSDGETTTQGTITVEVTNTYDAPTVIPGAAIDMLEDTVINLTEEQLLAGVNNPDNADITITDVFASEGEITVNSNGTYRYNPPNDYYGPVTINFTVFDGTTEVLSEITINIENVNDAPEAPTSPGSLGTINEDATFDGLDSTLLTGWTDIDFERDEEDTLPDLVVSDISVDHGTVERDEHGGFTITPDANYNGTVTVTYKVSDGTTEVTATRSLTVTAQPDAPVYDEDEGTDLTGAIEDQNFDIFAADLLDGFSDPDGTTTFYITAISVDEGTITPAGPIDSLMGSIVTDYTYTPDPDFYGDVTITYTVSDGVNTTEVTKTFNVAAVNDAPRGDAATITGVMEDTVASFTTAALLADIYDIDGSPVITSIMGTPVADLTITAISAIGGTIVWNEDTEEYDFTPDENYSGPASITYTVSDGDESAEFTSDFTIATVNDAPEGDAATVTGATEDTPLVLTTAELLADISDVEDDDLTITDIDATHGSISYDEESDSYTFTPTANYAGTATITYTVSDGEDSTEFTSTFTISGANDDPTAPVNPIDLGTATEDQAITIDAEDLLAGWTDVDGDSAFTVHNLDAGDGFTVVDNEDGTFTVTTPADYYGDIDFTYEVHDATDGVSYGNATIEVENVYDAPELDGPAELDSFDEDTSTTVSTEELLQGWSSADGLTLTLGDVTASHATVTEEDGVYTITPDADYNGTVTISYTVLDGVGDPVEASLDVTVNSVIDLITSGTSATLAAGKDNLTLTGSDDIDGTGNSLNNVITGNSGMNRLNGCTGADTMYGGAEDHLYIVDNTSDVASEQTVTGIDDGGFDTVRSSAWAPSSRTCA